MESLQNSFKSQQSLWLHKSPSQMAVSKLSFLIEDESHINKNLDLPHVAFSMQHSATVHLPFGFGASHCCCANDLLFFMTGLSVSVAVHKSGVSEQLG